MNKNDMMLNQLYVAKQTFRVVVNHLNQALFLQNDDGQLSYCNQLALNIIEQVCPAIFQNE